MGQAPADIGALPKWNRAYSAGQLTVCVGDLLFTLRGSCTAVEGIAVVAIRHET